MVTSKASTMESFTEKGTHVSVVEQSFVYLHIISHIHTLLKSCGADIPYSRKFSKENILKLAMVSVGNFPKVQCHCSVVARVGRY